MGLDGGGGGGRLLRFMISTRWALGILRTFARRGVGISILSWQDLRGTSWDERSRGSLRGEAGGHLVLWLFFSDISTLDPSMGDFSAIGMHGQLGGIDV